ncbi:APC family permease [Mycolicibacterium helvum]|uniref:Amino acid permease n=1 Tax=Mycolicibacterium helvum TaxID=1534349 RepID=A0A7I7TBI2_9MYCO|nr:APC family permease [Mycolicibacterium helvum]BBY65516.1 amino acid permease [Mycolicibacterium helvum]
MVTAGQTSTSSPPRKLMGTMTLALMVVAMASPVGVVVGTVPLMLGVGNGIGTPGAFVLVGVVLVIFAFGYAAIAQALPAAGGFFGFIRAGLGTRAGVAAGFVATTAYAVITVFVAALLSYFVSTFFRTRLGLGLDWSLWAVGFVAIAAVLMFFGVKESALVTACFLTVEFIILGALAIAVVIRQGPSAFPLASFSPAQIFSGSPGFALALAFLCFVGFEVTAVFTNHVRRPEKTIGRATMIGVIILFTVFATGAWVVLAGVGADKAITIAQGPDSGQLVPMVASANLGSWMGLTFEIVLMTSLFATLIVVFNTTAQYALNMSRTLAPSWRLARVHPKHGSPANAGITLAVILAAVLIGCRIAQLDPYLQVAAILGVLGSVAIFALEIMCAVAIFVFFRRSHDRRWWTTTLSPLTAAIALIVFLAIVLSNFAGLTGSTSAIVAWSPLIYVVVAVIGWFVGTTHPGTGEDGLHPASEETATDSHVKESTDAQ